MKKLLLVIDLQQGWWHTATKEAMLNSVALCKTFDGDIVHMCFKNDPTSLFHSQINWYRFVDTQDTQQIPEAAALNLIQLWRTTYTCLTDEFISLLPAYDHVYIAGVFTDISVAATAMGLFDLGKPVSVVKDCVGTLHGEAVHHAALRSLEHAIGRDFVIAASELQ